MRNTYVLLSFLLLLILLTSLSSVSARPKVVKCLDVPYVNQVYDVPEWFDGSASCGPTSVVMVLAYYGVLPPWPLNCSKPFPHVSMYGSYIVCKFKVGDFIFDEKEVDASLRSYGYGVHGYVYVPGIGADWYKMVEVFKIFGFEAYVDTTPTWEELVAEINAGRPVILSTAITSSGHIMVAVGYTADKSVIVNDPAGDKHKGYFNYYGKNVIYDWPGVDNGHINLKKVKALIIVRPTERLKKAEPLQPCTREEAINVQILTYLIIVTVAFVSLLVYFTLKSEKSGPKTT